MLENLLLTLLVSWQTAQQKFLLIRVNLGEMLRKTEKKEKKTPFASWKSRLELRHGLVCGWTNSKVCVCLCVCVTERVQKQMKMRWQDHQHHCHLSSQLSSSVYPTCAGERIWVDVSGSLWTTRGGSLCMLVLLLLSQAVTTNTNCPWVSCCGTVTVNYKIIWSWLFCFLY